MSDINKEIDQAAEAMEKSHKTPKEVLFETIRQLGPEGIRAKLPTLEKSEQELLHSALEEMKKAVEMDSQYAAKYVQGNIKDTKLQEDKADDDQDEKLVKPEAASINHQGQPTPGWEGQVIKAKEVEKEDKKKEAKEEKREKAAEKIMSMEEKEHGLKDPKKLVAAEKKEHEEDKKMKKGEDMEKKMGVPKGVDPDKQERCVRKVKGDKGKNPYAICNAAMKKGAVDEARAALQEIRKSVEEQLKELGVEATPVLVKSEVKRLLAEEDQEGDAPEMNEATRAKKENVEALNLGKDNKKNMTKSFSWSGDNELLKANTQGRNFHFSMDEYINEVMNKKPEVAEEVKKSQGKEDLNDIIEKGGDRNMKHFETEKLMKENKEKANGKVVKSFADNEIAQALGLTEEEAKKILGE